VALTGWGAASQTNPITVGSGLGLLTSLSRSNADASSTTIYGGVSALSASSGDLGAVTAQSVKVVVPATKGAVAYAVYISINATPSTANAFYAGIYPSSTFVINGNGSGAPAGYSASNQAANAAGLSSDNSANPLHFDGLLTWAFTGGYWQDFAGAGLTPDGQGGIQEFENVFQYLWDNFKLSPDGIVVGGSALIDSVTRAATVGGQDGNIRLVQQLDAAGNIIAGSLVRQYRVKYTGGPAKVIPIELHAWMPAGTILFDIRQNPYPDSNVPAPREMDLMADHFSIFWPLQTLAWTVGTYVFETLKHYVAFGSAVITSVGPGLNAVLPV
jgi:hypothetical protein